jgi:tripartite-type tricarboxylate transporter receptor subunit TctC
MTAIEKAEVKGVVRELIREDRAFFKELLQELLAENLSQESIPEPASNRAEQFDAIIKKDFERYKNVFKALA